MNNNINFSKGPVVVMEGCGPEPYHMHGNSQELIWVLEGEAGITFNNKEYILNTSDDLILIVDADFHRIRQIGKHLRFLSFYIDLPYFEKYIKDILHVGLYCNPGYRPAEQIPYLKKMRRLLAQIVWEYRSSESSQQIEDLTVKLLLLLRNHFNFLGTTSIDYKDQNTFDRMFKVYDFVYQHYTERVTLADLAEEIHVSSTYLSRSIKQITGMGFKDILNYVRCEEAVRLLLQTDKSITAIAYDCGFSDPKFFNQYFAKFFYGNPVDFRRNYKQPQEMDFPISNQRQVNYDQDLQERLLTYWQELDLYSSKPIHILYDMPCGEECTASAPDVLTVLMTPQDFAGHMEISELLQELQQYIGPTAIEVVAGDCRSEKTIRAWPDEIHDILQQRRIHLFCGEDGISGLYLATRIKTPIYYILAAVQRYHGSWEYGANWAICRMPFHDEILLIAWNSSAEKSIEFQIDFKAQNKCCLVIRYEFSSDTLDAVRHLVQEKLMDVFCREDENMLRNICEPSRSLETLHVGDYGLSFKLRPGQVDMLIIKGM